MRKKFFFFLACYTFMVSNLYAASPMPGYDVSPGDSTASNGGVYMGSPPYPPMYLPNGAVNLDDVWTENGGARLYWNSTRYPIQLKLAGQTWVDPALVPELFVQKASPAKKTYRPRRKAKPKTDIICFPADQVPEALRPKKKAAPASAADKGANTTVVVKEEAAPTPQVSQNQQPSVLPPPLEPSRQENTSIPAPRLQ